MRVGVGERSESVVILLSGGIPEGQFDSFSIDDDIGDLLRNWTAISCEFIDRMTRVLT